MRLEPYLRFGGNAREAFEFYRGCLGGDLSLIRVGDSPMAGSMPGAQDLIFHAELKKDGMILLGSDMVGPEGIIRGNTSVLTVTCDSLGEAEKVFGALSSGGSVGHPLSKADFGTIGDLQDKYGNDWFVFVAPQAG